MRGCLALALVAGAGAFSAPPASSAVGISGRTWAADGLPRGGPRRASQRPSGPAPAAGFGACAAAIAATAALGLAVSLRRRAPLPRTTRYYVVNLDKLKDKPELMTDEIYKGEGTYRKKRFKDPQEFNYVNPWEERVEACDELTEDQVKNFGHRYYEYKGPVYKQVPVAEGLQFPLDPTIYDEKYGLEPPPPGCKWGDMRDPKDGNWYMDVEGKKTQYWQGWGKRKTACAVVRILKGTGQFLINGRDAVDYMLDDPYWWLKACEPICALNEKNNFDIIVRAFSGGQSGQAGAIRLGLAKALQEYNYQFRPLMKRARYLTRDWRMVEPKKSGQPKARKKKPYHKR